MDKYEIMTRFAIQYDVFHSVEANSQEEAEEKLREAFEKQWDWKLEDTNGIDLIDGPIEDEILEFEVQ